ncbi:MAG: CHAP domain-containing protein [Bacteroidaceae bacterium]|nr:CHAP domain-containing protein [Bacteroidaceae bacterium]
MLDNPWWYSTASNPYLGWYNRFTNTGNGLPNCTCYAYGRYAEIRNHWESSMLPRGDAGSWYLQATDPNSEFYIGAGNFGQVPQLGAVICWGDPNAVYNSNWIAVSGYAGHVAIVERITYGTGGVIQSITTSNSAYGGSYFYTSTINRYNSMFPNDQYHISYHNNAYRTQGFIYNENSQPPVPPPASRRKMPLWMMLHYGI